MEFLTNLVWIVGGLCAALYWLFHPRGMTFFLVMLAGGWLGTQNGGGMVGTLIGLVLGGMAGVLLAGAVHGVIWVWNWAHGRPEEPAPK